jgi:hypothetical protein
MFSDYNEKERDPKVALFRYRGCLVPAVTAASAAAATATAPAIDLRPRFVHCQSPTAHVLAIQLFDRFVGIVICHLNEAKAARPAGVPVGNDPD